MSEWGNALQIACDAWRADVRPDVAIIPADLAEAEAYCFRRIGCIDGENAPSSCRPVVIEVPVHVLLDVSSCIRRRRRRVNRDVL